MVARNGTKLEYWTNLIVPLLEELDKEVYKLSKLMHGAKATDFEVVKLCPEHQIKGMTDEIIELRKIYKTGEIGRERCPECGKLYKNKNTLQSHISQVHR